MISYNPVIADSVVFTGHECNDEISSRFLVALRRYGRSQRMRSKPLNYTELAFCLRNSHPQDFLTLFGKDFASLVMLRGGTSRLRSGMPRDTANGSARLPIFWRSSRL